jgi:hypothetical protein
MWSSESEHGRAAVAAENAAVCGCCLEGRKEGRKEWKEWKVKEGR